MGSLWSINRPVELSLFKAKGTAFCTTCKVVTGCELPPEGGVCIISWTRPCLSTENSSPGKRDRVNHQLMPQRVWGLGPGQPRKVVQAEHCNVLYGLLLALLVTTCFSHVHSIQPHLQDSRFKFPGEIFKRRVSGRNSRAAAFSPEAVTHSHPLPSL